MAAPEQLSTPKQREKIQTAIFELSLHGIQAGNTHAAYGVRQLQEIPAVTRARFGVHFTDLTPFVTLAAKTVQRRRRGGSYPYLTQIAIGRSTEIHALNAGKKPPLLREEWVLTYQTAGHSPSTLEPVSAGLRAKNCYSPAPLTIRDISPEAYASWQNPPDPVRSRLMLPPSLLHQPPVGANEAAALLDFLEDMLPGCSDVLPPSEAL